MCPDMRWAETRATEYVLVHHDEKFALAWVTIDPCLAGGFTLWCSASVAESSFGRVCLYPYWRPDGQAARGAAWDLVIDLAEEARKLYDLPGGGFAVQICEYDDVLAEVPVPAGALAEAAVAKVAS